MHPCKFHIPQAMFRLVGIPKYDAGIRVTDGQNYYRETLT